MTSDAGIPSSSHRAARLARPSRLTLELRHSSAPAIEIRLPMVPIPRAGTTGTSLTAAQARQNFPFTPVFRLTLAAAIYDEYAMGEDSRSHDPWGEFPTGLHRGDATSYVRSRTAWSISCTPKRRRLLPCVTETGLRGGQRHRGPSRPASSFLALEGAAASALAHHPR